MSERIPSPNTPKSEAPTAEEYLKTEKAHSESAENLEAKKAEMTQAIESGDFAKVAQLAAEAQTLEAGTATLENEKNASFDAAYEEAHVENERVDAERASEKEQAAREQEKAAKESERISAIDTEIAAKRQELDQLKASRNFAGIGEIAKQIIALEAQKSAPVEENNLSARESLSGDEHSFEKYDSMTNDDLVSSYVEIVRNKNSAKESLDEQWPAKPEVVEITNLQREMGKQLDSIYFDPSTDEETKKLINTFPQTTPLNFIIANIDNSEYAEKFGKAVEFLREHSILLPETEEKIKNVMQEKENFYKPIEDEENESKKMYTYMRRRDPNLASKANSALFGRGS